MRFDRLAAIILSLAFIFGLGFRLSDISSKTMLSHDEGISYLAATGHQGIFKEICLRGDYPVGQWVAASEWKRFLRPDKFFCFKQIGRDLARYDLHPPLYFWLLHVWVSVFGTHMWAGPVLNLLLTALIMIFLYGFARSVLSSRLESAVVVFLWALSPYVLTASTVARQYDLFALFSLLLCWQVIRVIRAPDEWPPRRFVLLFLTALAGALTLYSFAMVVAGCAILTILTLGRRHTRRAAQVLIGLSVGYASFVVFHPKFMESFELARLAISQQAPGGVSTKLATVATALSQFFVHQRAGGVILVVIAVLIVSSAVAVLYAGSKTQREGDKREVNAGNLVVFLFLWNLVGVAVPYIATMSMAHAMGARYLGAAWLLIGFVPVLFVRRFIPKWRVPLLVALCGWQLFYGGAFAAVTMSRTLHQRTPGQILNAANAVLVDSVARGVLPRVFWLLGDDKVMFAASQVDMLRDPDTWVGHLPGGSLYVSHIGYG
ncbi:MAG: glycosyltransferase family 39 protein, partial [bacterium]